MHGCLRPGGSTFVFTPHVLHYFGATALITQRLHLDEWLLHRLGEETILHEHGCPLQSRMNTRHRLTRLARRAGFRHFEFQMLDDPGLYEPYFPGCSGRCGGHGPRWSTASAPSPSRAPSSPASRRLSPPV